VSATTERPIKLAFVTHSLDLGGSEQQMVALAERLPALGFHVSFILFEGRGPLIGRAIAANATVVPLLATTGAPRPSTLRRVYKGARLMAGLARALRQLRPDIVDAWLFTAYIATGITLPVTRVPAFVAGRRSLSDIKGARNPIEHWIGHIATKASSRIVANSEAVKKDAIAVDHEDGSKITVIRNGVLIPPAISTADRAMVRNRWSVEEDALVIVAIANYKEGKGLEDLLTAFAEIFANRPDAVLVLIGEGPLRRELQGLASSLGIERSVRLVGADPEARLSVRAADLAVHPSHSEGLPNVVLEEAAAGLATIATRAGGTAEAVSDGRTGLLVRPSAADLTQALKRLTQDPALRLQFGRAARADMAERFGMDRMAREFADLYRQVHVRAGRN
jgi:glycosyltransferase involved in cell wall biosynthesis